MSPDYYSYSFLSKLSDILMIFCPSFGYIAQAIKFKETKSSEGFSKYLCLIILISNILRIYFWIGKKFTIVLLYQSITVIIFQFYLIHVSLYYENLNNKKNNEYKPLNTNEYSNKNNINNNLNYIYDINNNNNFNLSIDFKHFWKWKNEKEYYKFIIYFFIILSLITNVFFNFPYYFEYIGTISAGLESVIVLPQIYSNFITKNVENISNIMIIMWFCGDSFKTIYYYYSNSPIQLIVCGTFQIFLDVVVLYQLWYYSKKINDDGNIKKMEVNFGNNNESENNILMKDDDEV
jgi:uncharacterized protein with PQ loop repeat